MDAVLTDPGGAASPQHRVAQREAALGLYEQALVLRGEPQPEWSARIVALKKQVSADYYNTGMKLMRTDMNGAVKAFEASVKFDPQNANAQQRLSEATAARDKDKDSHPAPREMSGLFPIPHHGPDEAPPKPERAEPTVGPETEFSGALLKAIREARGIDLADIAQRSKIGISHLRAIEDERWELMPATVYLRGFVVEYARTLKLDVSRVTRSFLDRYHRARPAREA